MGDPVSIGLSLGFAVLNQVINPGQTTTNRVKREAQRLADLGAPDASFGFPIRDFYGLCRIEGCSMIWATDLEEEITVTTETTVNQTRGKGGGSRSVNIVETEVATYYINAAFLIGGPISKIHRMWANGKQIYNDDDWNANKDSNPEHISVKTRNATEFWLGDQRQRSEWIAGKNPRLISNAPGDDPPSLYGYSYIVFKRYPIELYEGSGFPRIDVEVHGLNTVQNPDLRVDWNAAFTAIASKAGIPSTSINTSLSSEYIPMIGAAFENNGESYAEYLNDLFTVHLLDFHEYNNKLEIWRRYTEIPGWGVVVEKDDLGARAYGEDLGDIYIRKNTDPITLPSEVRIDFISAQKNTQRNNVVYIDPTATHTKVERVNTRVVTTETSCVNLSRELLHQAKIQSQSIEDLYLMPSYAGLKVGHLIIINEKSVNREYRITEVTIGDDYRVKISAVATPGTHINPNV